MKKETYTKIIDYVADNYDDEVSFAYDTETDDVEVIINEYGSSKETYISLPRTTSKEGYQLMVSFADTQNNRISYQLNNALAMRKPFANFNSTLKKLHKDDEFLKYKRDHYTIVVNEWMAENDLKVEENPIDFPGWQSLFKSHILQRGLDYYKDNKVSSVKLSDNTIAATVYNYDISIKYKDNKIVRMYCDCPCDFNCKHEAAVLYLVEKEGIKKDTSSSYKNNSLSVDYRKKIRNSLYLLNDEGQILLNDIKSFFESDDDSKIEFLRELSELITYADKYYFLTRNKIIDYLIDKASELNNSETLVFFLKTGSIEEHKSKVLNILKDNFYSDETIKTLLKQEETIKQFFENKLLS